MNRIITSRDAILDASCRLVTEQGMHAVNMRSVAAACGVAVGSVYNYFPSKAELVGATVQKIWQDIFHGPVKQPLSGSFLDNVSWLFGNMQKGFTEYPGFFTLHAMSFAAPDKEKGREMMEQSFRHIRQGMLAVLEKDSGVRAGAFDGTFTQEQLVDMVFSFFMSLPIRAELDCTPLLEMIRRSIY